VVDSGLNEGLGNEEQHAQLSWYCAIEHTMHSVCMTLGTLSLPISALHLPLTC